MINPQSYRLYLLKRRLRSRAELEKAMTRRGVPPEEQDAALSKLTKAGLIDDLRFAKAWVQSRDRLNPRGAYVLRQELVLKGISKDLIDRALGEREVAMREQVDTPDEVELAKQLIKGKERLYAHLAPEVRKRRLMAFLGRRGFSYEVIRRILDS